MSRRVIRPSLFDVIRSPVVTEKATGLAGFSQVVFHVRPEATKADVREAVEALFGVNVVAVNTLRVRGKLKRGRNGQGRRPGRKKAIVRLAGDEFIDISAGIPVTQGSSG